MTSEYLAAPPPLLVARGLVKRYDGRRVVDALDLECRAGTVLGLLGPNGAGKTTTLRMLYGFIEPEAGEIRYDGRSFQTDREALERLIGVCAQDDTTDHDFTVEQNLRVYASYFRPSPPDLDRRVHELLDQFGLREFAQHSPDELSGGYRRRLMIARSLVHEPKLLFLDEPTTGLDPAARLDVWRLIAMLRAQGLAIILTTHYMDEAERLSDEVVVLAKGKAVAQGAPRALLDSVMGDHMAVTLVDEVDAARLTAWTSDRLGAAPLRVLDEWHVPLRATQLTQFSTDFADVRFKVRDPTLEDLFLKLSLDPSEPPVEPSRDAPPTPKTSDDPAPAKVRWRPHLRDLPDWRTRAVFFRNARVYLRNWRTAFLPPALEPIVTFLAFGLGLGGYVGAMTWQGTDVNYATYMAPGLLAQTAFATPFFEALYSSYVRMFYQKTWDGILASQVELRHIVWGEITWAAWRGFMNTTVVALVVGTLNALGLVHLRWEWLLALPPLAFVVGWAFSAFALIFTATVPSMDHMNYPVFIVGVPLGLVSATFFPIPAGSPWLLAAMQANPVYHLAETFRGLLLNGTFDAHLGWLAVTSAAMLVVCATVAQRLVRRRVLGE